MVESDGPNGDWSKENEVEEKEGEKEVIEDIRKESKE